MKRLFDGQRGLYVLVFVLFVIVRGIPEIQAGDLPCGWDTTNYYAPWTIAFATHGVLNQHFLAAPPMIFVITLILNSFANNILLVLKILPSVLYGFFGVSVLYFTRNYLLWSKRKSILCSLLLVFQPTALRISWDLLKNELALCLLFLQMPLIRFLDEKGKKLSIPVALVSLGIVLSHQYVSIIYFAILLAIVMDRNKTKSFKKHILVASIPALTLFIIIFGIYAGLPLPLMSFNANTDWFFKSVHYIDVPMFSILTNYILRFGSHLNFIMFAGELFFLQYLFVLLLVPFGFWNDRFLSPFLVLTAIGSFLPLLTPTYGIPDWDRWMFMLVYPFTIYATNAISKLISYSAKRKASNSKQNKTLRFHKAFVRKLLAGAYVLFIVVFGINYVLGNLSSFYNPILGYIPPSMSHKPLSSQEAQDIIANIKWLNTLNNNHNNASSVGTPSQTQEESSFCLVCEDKDHGFIRLYLNEDIEIVVFYSDLDAALSFAQSRSYSRVFMLLQTEPYIHEFEVVNRMHYYSLYTVEKIPTFTTISIRADGLVDPLTAPIKRDGDTYILTSSINSDADGIIVQRDNIVLDGAAHVLHGKGNGTGIDLSGRRNVTLRNIQIEAFYMGIKLSSSFYDTIIENAILQNGDGIYTYDSSNNTMARNNMTDNWGGIYVYISSNNNSVMENSVENNNGGIYLWSSLDNLIYENTIKTNNEYGVCLDESSNSNISGNRIEGNGAGLWVKPASSGNVIYHNYFKSNKVHVLTENSTNAWDNGYPAGGNYWSDYAVGDLNFDGIGDHPFLIDANNTDRYPLMGVYYGFHITSEQSVSAISNSTIFNLTFDNENSVISFNVNGNGGQGFCMLMIPKSLMNGPLTVIIDGKATNATELPFSDSAHTYLYFTYIQGTHRITIVPKTGVS